MRHAYQPSKTVSRVRAVLSVAFILSFWACSTARNAEDAFNRGNYVAAAELWAREAERGDLKALCACIAAVNLVHDAQKVQHLSAQLEKAFAKLEHSGTKAVQDSEVLSSCLPTYYRRAAAGGNAHAQYALAEIYRREEGKAAEGERLVESATKNGSPEAQWEMGVRHMFDDDKSTTVRWWKLSAAQGYYPALGNLGNLYRDGRGGVPQDFEAAAKLFAEGAQRGFFEAQMNIGEMYAKGQGVPQDFVQAHFWFNVAGTKGTEQERKRANEARHNCTEYCGRADRRGIAPRAKLASPARSLLNPWIFEATSHYEGAFRGRATRNQQIVRETSGCGTPA